jgi:hypothetical protein
VNHLLHVFAGRDPHEADLRVLPSEDPENLVGKGLIVK